VVRLGLRVSDIRELKFYNLNWSRKTISLTMQKTKQSLKLPLLDDIGWAVIDYLKNGRPETKCDAVFVRHRALQSIYIYRNLLSDLQNIKTNKLPFFLLNYLHILETVRQYIKVQKNRWIKYTRIY